jgi:hypothetical protein
MGWCYSSPKGNAVSPCAGVWQHGREAVNCVCFGFEEAVWFKWDCRWISGVV